MRRQWSMLQAMLDAHSVGSVMRTSGNGACLLELTKKAAMKSEVVRFKFSNSKHCF